MNTILQKRIDIESNKYMEEAIEMNSVVGDNLHYEDLKTCFIEAADFALQNQWISVEEALPEPDQLDVFVMNEYGKCTSAWYSHKTRCWFLTYGEIAGDDVLDSKITHWMPIPELKGGEK